MKSRAIYKTFVIIAIWIFPLGISAQEHIMASEGKNGNLSLHEEASKDYQAQACVDELVAMGFENVACSDFENERIFVLECTAWRIESDGLVQALEKIAEKGMTKDRGCRVIVLDNNIPQISLWYSADDENLVYDKANWKVSYDLGSHGMQVGTKKEASSLYKLDVTVYPEFLIKNMLRTKIYECAFMLSPALEVSLWKGMSVSGQLIFPLYVERIYGISSDNAGFYDKIRPGFLTVSQSFRLPYNVFGTLSVGSFNNNRMGADLQTKWYFCHDLLSAEARVGYTAYGAWEGFRFAYNMDEAYRKLTWSLGGNLYWPRFNTQAGMKVEKYLGDEVALRLDLIRHFKYASIGFYALKADGIKANGGFRFQIALPPYKYARKGYAPRVLPSEYWGLSYNAGNSIYYKSYKAQASDNMAKSNEFNPYYVESLIKK